MIRVLTYSSFFPSAPRPLHGIAVAERLRHLIASGAIESHVIAPVPWFPLPRSRLLQRYVHFAHVPPVEDWHGTRVLHPRYPVIPKIGTSIAPALMALWTRAAVTRLDRETGGFDVIDAHGLYPDGVAAVMLGRWLNRPVVVTARGSDVNLNRRYAIPRRLLRWAVARSEATITVSGALKNALIEIGAQAQRIVVLRNGVDLGRFRPLDRPALRASLKLHGTVLLSVGNLLELKGHHLAIGALPALPDTILLIAGDGPMRAELELLARTLGVAERVRFLGAVANDRLVDYYNAADALVLLSSREGMANVLLESLACGTPVVTTAVGGSPEIVDCPEAGVLIAERSVAGFLGGLRVLLAALPARVATVRHAQRFAWEPTTQGQLELFAHVAQRLHSIPLTEPRGFGSVR